MAKRPIIQLDRRFKSLSAGEKDDSETNALRLALDPRAYGETWETVRSHVIAVVRAGAGSGKTEEFRSQIARLRNEGKTAFFVRLEKLARSSLADAISNEDGNPDGAFVSWKKRGGPATFFLDALDEARLPRGANGVVLDGALRAFESGVAPWGKDVHVMFSTRSSEWRDEIDRLKIRSCSQRLRQLERDDQLEANAVGVYALLPLQRDQVSKLADANNIDGRTFVSSIIEAKIESLAQTPFEVGLLLDIWDSNVASGMDGAAGFRNRSSVFEQAVDHKLRPTDTGERRSELSVTSVHKGVRALAAASTLTGLRDFSLFEVGDTVIDPRPVLAAIDTDWNEASIRQLLSYSFFDPDSGGRVRFSHKELQDYLAAQFFDRAIRRLGGSLKPIDPLIGKFADQLVLDSALLNFFGWLATMNPIARRKITTIQPSLLMETGDPSVYSLTERQDILNAHGAQYRNRNRRGEWFYDTDLSVFAQANLAPTVATLIESSPSDEFRANLIDLARTGMMTSLADTICSIACNPYLALSLRKTANEALLELGKSAHREAVRDQALVHIRGATTIEPDKAGDWNGYVLSSALALADSAQSLEDFRPFLSALSRERRNQSSGNSRIARVLVERFQQPAEDWLAFILEFVRGTRDGQHDRLLRCVPETSVLLPALATCFLKCIEEDNLSQSVPLLDAIEICCSVSYRDGDFGYSKSIKSIAEALRPHTELKMALLERRWSLIPDRRPVSGGYEIVHPLAMGEGHDTPTFWISKDVEALVARAKSTTGVELQQRLVSAADAIWHHFPDIEDRKSSYKAVSAFARQSKDRDIRRRFSPPRFRSFFRLQHWLVHQRGYAKIRRRARTALEEPYRRVKKSYDFWKHRHRIRSGKALRFLTDIAHAQPKGTQNGTVTTHFDWVEKTYGMRTARDIRQGYVAIWRGYRTQEIAGEDKNWAIAQAAVRGIEIELEEGTLSRTADDARRAFAIAFHVLNSLPDWIVAFLPDHGDLLASMLEEPARSALRNGGHPQRIPAEPLSRLRYAPLPIRRVAAPVIAAALRENSLCPVENLEAALAIILHTEETGIIDRDWATSSFRAAAASGELERAWVWMVYLYRADAAFAWRITEPWIRHVWPTGETSPFIGFMARYREMMDRAADSQNQDDLQHRPEILLNLALIGLRTARPESDPWHEGVYSPGIRDTAAEQRRYWFEQLSQTGNEDTYWALRAAAISPEHLSDRDTFSYQADRLAKSAAKPTFIRKGDINAFMSSFGAAPKTREQFSSYVKKLVDTLLYRLANSDHDEARPYRRGRTRDLERDEEDLRNWLSARLSETADNIFTITREAEAARRNRTDILITARLNGLGCVVIEVKLADRDHWSGAELVTTLETQVRDKYLLEDEKHTGLLVLINTAGGEFQKSLDRTPISFEELVGACERAAQALNGNKSYAVSAISL
ncbi:NACHT domain-containing protein [Henriciella mobilis]|uniref:Uncharacterized protein n=1 Tax=Henriciella mobilis TaxID=2305467 RepID=A0A399RTF4_9PROT|nr:hypothetical protein [Henriciella mobilis]RIJ32765.1 hypothetical protein D1223_02655 [Henriciella mobilis]